MSQLSGRKNVARDTVDVVRVVEETTVVVEKTFAGTTATIDAAAASMAVTDKVTFQVADKNEIIIAADEATVKSISAVDKITGKSMAAVDEVLVA